MDNFLFYCLLAYIFYLNIAQLFTMGTEEIMF